MADAQQPDQYVSDIHSYLAAKGLQPTGENVRRALEMNASNPGLIAGLRNQAPPSDSSNGAGKQGSDNPHPTGTQHVNGVNIPEPPMPTTSGANATAVGDDGKSSPQAAPHVNVQPPDANGNGMSLATMLGLGTIGGGGVLAALGKLLSARSGAPSDVTPPVAAPPSAVAPPATDAQAAAAPSADPEMNDSIMSRRAQLMRNARQPGPTSPTSAVLPPGAVIPEQPDSFKTAMDRAVPPPANDAVMPRSVQLPAAMPMDSGDVTTIMRHAQANPEAAGAALEQLSQLLPGLEGMKPVSPALRALRGIRAP